MRAALAVAPRWAQSVAIGVYFGLIFALGYRAWGENWASVLVAASLGSVIFGGSTYRIGWARDRELRETLLPLEPAQRRLAVRAAHRGPVPDAPAVLDAALDIADNDLARTEEHCALTRVLLAAMTLAAGIAAIVQLSPWWAIVAVLLGATLTVHLIFGYTLPGRIARLRAGRSALPGFQFLDDV
ncbi:MAG: hypothetical protein M3Y49_01830 [Actinomycetota bacterium]|nr:hypothetical protein [Actinomycetota bacterium]